VASLVLVPFALFLSVALSGHLLLPGDDLIQNYPLRVLVGWDLRHGHLPLWDPYEWSGAPLLAGFNAGALYPSTFLFAILPASLAWSIGQALVYATAGTGLYFFLRRRGFGPEAAWLAAVVFSGSGFMVAHLNHLGLIEGMSWVGWILLALDHLARPAPPGAATGHGETIRARVRWSALLGLFGGLFVLAGDPRAVSNVAVVAAVFGAWLVWRSRGSRIPLLVSVVASGVLATLIGAGQLLPGLEALSVSQRSVSSLAAFGAGSLSAPQLLLFGVPFLLGGFGTFGLPAYSANYNLAEISGYLGLLPLAGAFGVIGGFLAGTARRLDLRRLGLGLGLRRRSRSPAEHRNGSEGAIRGADGPATGAWVGLAVVGVLLALGDQTPLGHVLVHIPLYSGQRLQSRNLGVIDVALAVLFCIWVDRYLPRSGAGSAWRGVVRGTALLAPGLVLAVFLAAAVAPGTMRRLLQANNLILGYAWPFLIASGILAVAVTALLLFGERIRRRRLRLVSALVLLDVAFFLVNGLYGWNSTAALKPDPGGTAQLAGQLSGNERFAVYDPDLAYPSYVIAQPGNVRVPDQNVLSQLSSVQGYGSFVADTYENATGAHSMGHLNLSLLRGPLADELDLRLVLVPPKEAPDLRPYLTAPRWRYEGEIAGLMAFRNTDHLAPAYLAPPTSGGASTGQTTAGSVRQLSTVPLDGSATFEVTAPSSVRLIRSSSWYTGWTATLVPVGGGRTLTRPATAADSGLLQSVVVPPGRWRVSFSYRPSGVVVGLVSSGVGLLAVLGGLLLVGLSRGRRRVRAARDEFARLLETNPRYRRLWRYTVTSVVSTVASEVTLLVTYGTHTLGAVTAAVVANLAGTIPSYPMSRYWIWPEANREHTARQVAGYWLVSLASLVASSAATGVAADYAPAGGVARLVVVGAAYIGTLVVLWLAKLAVYHFVLFRPPPDRDLPSVAAGAEHQPAG
jgi:putative flippase GtrA